jgi:hypothetical protein
VQVWSQRRVMSKRSREFAGVPASAEDYGP